MKKKLSEKGMYLVYICGRCGVEKINSIWMRSHETHCNRRRVVFQSNKIIGFIQR